MSNKLLNIAIAGATGYVGIELIKILHKHPRVKIKYLCSKNSVGKSIDFFEKSFKNKKLPIIKKLSDIDWSKIDLIFTSLPNGQAQIIAKKIPKSVKLIDLSGDFRLKRVLEYKKWYKTKHKSKNLVKDSIYSIPEFNKDILKKYKIISCPGCYPTSILLPLVPLFKKKLIKKYNVVVDSKSGYSGGGKKIHTKFKSRNIYNTVSAYGVGAHKHMAEIDQELSKFSKIPIKINFTPHLIPMFRGILSTIYIDLNKNISANILFKFLKKYHKKNYFIKFSKFNSPLSTNDVINTNFCRISVCKTRYKNKIIILSAIDNLIKGASGQAVQNMNLSYGLRETIGLL